MTDRVELAPKAVADFDELLAYLVERNPTAAVKLRVAILDEFAPCANHPPARRPRRHTGDGGALPPVLRVPRGDLLPPRPRCARGGAHLPPRTRAHRPLTLEVSTRDAHPGRPDGWPWVRGGATRSASRASHPVCAGATAQLAQRTSPSRSDGATARLPSAARAAWDGRGTELGGGSRHTARGSLASTPTFARNSRGG
ncbi:MAG: type II toxin-antitoxin system RelE/ParE family toxin [Myxococcaceae bacterium]|nr:MAG: type II toxin-antitoxin system RelE/ParE family toxin [Myxococcaceae bacterium]